MAGNYLFIYLEYESCTYESYLIIVLGVIDKGMNESKIRKR